MSEALTVTNLTRSFGHSTVLEAINLRLTRGDRLAVVGYSGSGKTTLLRLIAGLDVPTAGEIALGGRLVSTAGKLLVPPERRRVAMVFQGLALFPHLRALDQIAFASRGHGGRDRARQLLERVGLGHRASAPLDKLSGGERQRIALARALAQQPDLILMDEPFASLDEPRRAEMRRLLRSLLDDSQATLILVTHARDDALDFARRTLVLERGRPVANDTVDGLLTNPRHATVVRCFGLGQLIDGETTDGTHASTSFGVVALARPVPAGAVRLLVRPGQARMASRADEGADGEIEGVAPRPPDTEHDAGQCVVVRVGGQTLQVPMRETAAWAGQPVRVRIEGACVPVAG